MAAEIIAVVSAMVTAINAGTYNQAVTAARSYGPAWITTTASGTNSSVDVQPAGTLPAIVTRGGTTTAEFRVSVGIRKRITIDSQVPDAGQCDDMVELVEQIIGRLVDVKNFAGTTLEAIELDTPYQVEAFERAAVFFTVFELTTHGSL